MHVKGSRQGALDWTSRTFFCTLGRHKDEGHLQQSLMVTAMRCSLVGTEQLLEQLVDSASALELLWNGGGLAYHSAPVLGQLLLPGHVQSPAVQRPPGLRHLCLQLCLQPPACLVMCARRSCACY